MDGLVPSHNSKMTRIFIDCKGKAIQGIAGHESHRKRLEYNEERDW